MKRGFRVWVLLALSIVLMSGAASGEDKVGYIGALTGDTAVWGQAGLNGMKLTAQKVNDTGGVLGYKIEVLVQDGKGKPEDSLNALSKLIDEGVIAVAAARVSTGDLLRLFTSTLSTVAMSSFSPRFARPSV